MGVEVFHVICGAVQASGGPGGNQEITKTEIEALDKRFTEKVIILGPFQRASIVTLEAETAIIAARFCKYILKMNVNGVVPGAAAPLTDAEAGKKPLQTVKTTAYENPTI